MTNKVKIHPAKLEFQSDPEGSILDAAISSNIYLAHSCMNGNCGICKSRLLKGDIRHLSESQALSETEIRDGFILTCCSQALSDIEIEADYYPELSSINRMIQPCKVESIEFPVIDVAILKLKLPPAADFRFLPGQYIQLIIKGERRSYSIANIMDTYTGIELHIRKVDGGVFSEYIFNELKKNQLLQLDGPVGSFFVRKEDGPVVFLAGGTGFAPVKSMVEQLIKDKTDRKIYIYWGVSSKQLLYTDIANKWQSKYGNIEYIPVVSDDNSYKGRQGLVHRAVLEDFNDLSVYDVYACGSPEMIETARDDFIASGMKPEKFYSDAFVSTDKNIKNQGN